MTAVKIPVLKILLTRGIKVAFTIRQGDVNQWLQNELHKTSNGFLIKLKFDFLDFSKMSLLIFFLPLLDI